MVDLEAEERLGEGLAITFAVIAGKRSVPQDTRERAKTNFQKAINGMSDKSMRRVCEDLLDIKGIDNPWETRW